MSALPSMEGMMYKGVLYVREQDCRATVNAALEKRNAKHAEETAALRAELAAAKVDADWFLHNAGLLNEWAKEWCPDSCQTLIAYLRTRIDAARGAKGRE